MISEKQVEHPYSVKIETSTGQSASVPVAFLTPKQIEHFLQFDFKRLVQEAGVKGARVHMEPATTVDYQKVLREIAAWLRTANVRTASNMRGRVKIGIHHGEFASQKASH